MILFFQEQCKYEEIILMSAQNLNNRLNKLKFNFN